MFCLLLVGVLNNYTIMLVRRIVSSPLFFQSYKKPLFSFRSQPNVTFSWLVRSYTTEKAEKMKLTIATPSNVLIKNKLVDKIKIPGATGDFVLLPNHVSYISELRPGLIVVEDEKNQEKFFVSGGFVFFHKNSTCSVHAAECVPLQHLDLDLAQK